MKVLCIGHASYDISIPVDEYPKENTKYRIETRIEGGGGPASNAAYLLGKWGVDTYFQSILGNDVYGNRIKKEFEDANVNTSYVEISNDCDTSLSFILVNKHTASRTLFNCAAKRLQIEDVKYDFTPDIIHVDGNYFEASKKAFEIFPDAIKVIDAGRVTDELLELCTMVDYLVCSKGFAETVSKVRIDYANFNSLKEVYAELEKKFKKATIIITLEQEGCMFKMDDKIKLMSALKVREKDTTGAGDIFHGAFVFGLSKKLPLEKCIKIANITAGLSCCEIGTRASVPELEKVYKIYEKNK